MKIPKKPSQVTKSTDFDSMNFTVGDSGIIMDILRNKMYRYPIDSLVREYISNARDANREAGTKHKVLITIPTYHEMTFSVRDFGLGISPERMAIFTTYANSTKRETNTQIGGFGIGSKSAWAYTDSFNVTTFINGVKREYVATIEDDRQGTLNKLSEDKTNQPDGTLISVPVRGEDIVTFKNAAMKYFMFAHHEVDIRNVRREVLNEQKIQGVKITDSTYYVREPVQFICVDWVPYSINFSSHILVNCGIEDVELTASREDVAAFKTDENPLRIDYHRILTTNYLQEQLYKISSKEELLKFVSDNDSALGVHSHFKFKTWAISRDSIIIPHLALSAQSERGSNMTFISWSVLRKNEVYYNDLREKRCRTIARMKNNHIGGIKLVSDRSVANFFKLPPISSLSLPENFRETDDTVFTCYQPNYSRKIKVQIEDDKVYVYAQKDLAEEKEVRMAKCFRICLHLITKTEIKRKKLDKNPQFIPLHDFVDNYIKVNRDEIFNAIARERNDITLNRFMGMVLKNADYIEDKELVNLVKEYDSVFTSESHIYGIMQWLHIVEKFHPDVHDYIAYLESLKEKISEKSYMYRYTDEHFVTLINSIFAKTNG